MSEVQLKDHLGVLVWAMRGLTFHDPEEVMWDVGVEALMRAADNYTSERGSFRAFAFRCVRNAYLDYRHPKQLLIPIRHSVEHEDTSVVDRIWEGLTGNERSLLEARYWQGLSFKDIGLLYGCAKSTAKNRVDRALEHCRKLL